MKWIFCLFLLYVVLLFSLRFWEFHPIKKKKDTRHSKTSKFRQANNGCRLIMYKIYRKKKRVFALHCPSQPPSPRTIQERQKEIRKEKKQNIERQKRNITFQVSSFFLPPRQKQLWKDFKARSFFPDNILRTSANQRENKSSTESG